MPLITQSILKVVVYFNLFDYPVTAEEIHSFLDHPFKETEVKSTLAQLVFDGELFLLGKFYSVRNDMLLAHKREVSNNAAVKEIERAKKIAKFLYQFPFVRGVGISGSLSKNCASESSDLDFFIITKANRLWIARSILFIYYRLAKPVQERRQICLNYFIDEEALEIADKNFYTSMEVVTLIPCEGPATMQDFFKANAWMHTFFPNRQTTSLIPKTVGKLPKKITEALLDNALGNYIDSRSMQYFKKRWKQLFDRRIYTANGNRSGAYNAEKHYCKQMPGFLQKKILDKFDASLTSVQQRKGEAVLEDK